MKHWADGDAPHGRPSLAENDAEFLEQAYTEAIRLGFLGPREQDRLWERHLNDALGLASIRQPRPQERWADLGSGAGLPGLPLAVAYQATSFTMIDAQRRRLDWVAATAAALGLANVTAVHARLEDYGQGPARQSFDVATARRHLLEKDPQAQYALTLFPEAIKLMRATPPKTTQAAK